MYLNDLELDDSLLPDLETMREFLGDEHEQEVEQPSLDDEFNETPESMALWMEQASHHFNA